LFFGDIRKIKLLEPAARGGCVEGQALDGQLAGDRFVFTQAAVKRQGSRPARLGGSSSTSAPISVEHEDFDIGFDLNLATRMMIHRSGFSSWKNIFRGATLIQSTASRQHPLSFALRNGSEIWGGIHFQVWVPNKKRANMFAWILRPHFECMPPAIRTPAFLFFFGTGGPRHPGRQRDVSIINNCIR
jgi:hypothetical protein